VDGRFVAFGVCVVGHNLAPGIGGVVGGLDNGRLFLPVGFARFDFEDLVLGEEAQKGDAGVLLAEEEREEIA
jgi:hypothetical protein